MSISSAVKCTGVSVQIRSSTPDTVVDGLPGGGESMQLQKRGKQELLVVHHHPHSNQVLCWMDFQPLMLKLQLWRST